MKPGRNDPCPCGSGKKYKKCCQARVAAAKYSVKEVAPTTGECEQLSAMFSAGRIAEAEARARVLLESYPDSGFIWKVWAASLMIQGKQGLPALQKAAELLPEDAELHYNLGNALMDLGRLAEAAASYRRALEIKPDFAEAHYNLGNALKDLGRLDDAVASYRRALQIEPEDAEAHYNLGVVLMNLGRLDDAVASHRRALEIKPDYAAAHYNLGIVLMELRRLDDAVACYRRALEIKPDLVDACINLGVALMDLGRLDDAMASYRRALEIKPDYADAHSNLLFALNYLARGSSEEMLAIARDYEARFGAPLRTMWRPHGNSREPGRRLRVGYVSPDFRSHAVAYFVEPIIANHDRERVEIYCYAEVKREDAYTERIRRMAEHWHSSVGLSDAAMAELIREHQIDILVDLAGHSANNRLRVFARKPAPIQVTYLGYPGTTGLAAMDYRITDRHTDPEGIADARYVERLVRLPDSLWCYRPAPNMPEITPLPALSRGYVTYGSFNSFNKIDRQTVALWASLLREQPSARLTLFTVPEGEVRQRVSRDFADHGVDAARLAFHGRLPTAEFHRNILEVDMALDPVTVNGGTTTCESLWMGVPVISLSGTSFLSRAGLSILKTIGMAELAVESEKDYLRIAAHLADNLPLLAGMRSKLRAQMAASALTDEVAFTRNLEMVYRDMWVDWCVRRDSNSLPLGSKPSALSK